MDWSSNSSKETQLVINTQNKYIGLFLDISKNKLLFIDTIIKYTNLFSDHFYL